MARTQESLARDKSNFFEKCETHNRPHPYKEGMGVESSEQGTKNFGILI